MRNVLERQGADPARAEEKGNVHQYETRENHRERVGPSPNPTSLCFLFLYLFVLLLLFREYVEEMKAKLQARDRSRWEQAKQWYKQLKKATKEKFPHSMSFPFPIPP